MLLIFLLNVGGYYVVFLWLRYESNKRLEARLDAEKYTTDELVEIRLPVSLPYPLQEQGFQRVNGRFEHEGQFYKMVKQKIDGDELIIVCIKDHDEKRLDKNLRDYSKLANDIPTSSKKTQNILSKLVKDFESTESNQIVHGNMWDREISLSAFDPFSQGLVLDLSVPPPRA